MSYSPTAPLRRAAVALAAMAACAGAYAANTFTFDPAAAGLAGTSFTADNVLISDYSTVTFDGSGGFTETGFLPITNFQLGGTLVTADGLNSTYGLYVSYTASGTTTAGDPTTTPTIATFTDLTYTLYGYNGPAATFGFAADNTPTETASGEVTLATGDLISGYGFTLPAPGTTGGFSAGANMAVTFNTVLDGFFVSPSPFYDQASAIFGHTPNQVVAFDGGFRVEQGGGPLNFNVAPAIPEPETYMLMLAGLAAVGFIGRRRRAD